MKRASLLTLTLIGAFSAIQAAWAVDYPLPPTGSRLVGQNQTYTVQEGDKNLQAIARRFDTAAMLILEANNTIAPVPKPGTTITIPSQLLLPDAPRQGIIVNLAELRLYYYPPGENIVLLLNKIDLIIDAAIDGHGLAYLPYDQVERAIKEKKLIRVLDKFTPDLPGYLVRCHIFLI